jgi:2-dehydro-3-deoxygluconokinase
MLLRLWHDEGVDTRAVIVDRDAPTGVYFVTHGEQGHVFSYLRSGSAASRMQPADVSAALLARTRFLHVSGISQAISASATDTVLHAIELARAASVVVAYDPNLRLKLWPLARARAIIVATLALADYFLPSYDDVRTICGREDPLDILAWCHAGGARNVALKMGAQGVWVSDGATTERVAAHRVQAIDATGAGDCFDGTLLARLAQGDDLLTAARWANAAAALTTTGYGAVAPLPTRDRVARFLADVARGIAA